LINGNMSAISTALPRMRAATAIEMEEDGAIPCDEKVDRRWEQLKELLLERGA